MPKTGSYDPFHSGFNGPQTHENRGLIFQQLNFNRIALSLHTPLDWFWSYIRSEHLE